MKIIENPDYRKIHIIEETELVTYPELIFSPAGLHSVVLLETRDSISTALRDASGKLYLIYQKRAVWSEKTNAESREECRNFYEHIVRDDRRIVTQLLASGFALDERTSELIELPPCAYMTLGDVDPDPYRLEEPQDWLSFIREHCAPEDCYGVYGAFGSAFWWWEEKPRVLHIMGSRVVNLPEDRAEYYEEYAGREYYIDQNNSHPDCIALCCGWGASLSRLVVHEGIAAFTNVPLTNQCWGFTVDEVILPSTLRVMPALMCYADHVTIPETLPEIDLEALWIDCGGHFDPVSYTFRSLRLPSSIKIDVDTDEEDYHGQLPLLEPIAFWEEIVLYGDEPIRDLEPWYDSNVFLCGIRILYPAAWDEKTEESFAERIVSYVRSRKPQYGRMSGMDSVWFDWGEEEYRKLRERIRAY